jgi:hypothetical protein
MHVCAGIQRRSSSLTEQGIPVVFHTDYSPAGLLRRVQRILSTHDVTEGFQLLSYAPESQCTPTRPALLT